MSEGANNGPFKKGSASESFNSLIGGAIKSREKAPLVVGVDNAEDQIAVQNWLAEPRTESFFQRLKKGAQKTLGIVHKIEDHDGEQYVDYLDQHGMSMEFVYDPKDPRFAEAPEGFKVGDIILNEFSHGVKFEKVKPVNLPPKTEKKVIRRFLQAFKK